MPKKTKPVVGSPKASSPKASSPKASSPKADSPNSTNKNVPLWQRLFYYFILCAFMGFIYENLLDFFVYKHLWQWQGPLHGPWLVIYGFGGVVILLLLERAVKKKIYLGPLNIMPVFIALAIFAITGVVEYVGHWILDTFFNFRPWDYTEKPFNLNGRICLEDTLRFVVLGLLELYAVVPLVEWFLKRISKNTNTILFIVLAGLFLADVIISVIIMLA
ncbi:MAG: putative ABC transporter permease [Coriobacteriia bacterium]|nr:putative ABC transporter permease [Coriobacteriia bacterium]